MASTAQKTFALGMEFAYISQEMKFAMTTFHVQMMFAALLRDAPTHQ
jgi:hypothetical protein